MIKKYEGKINMVMGTAKQKVGALTGNKALERDGQYQKIKGVTQDATEGAKAVVRGASKEALKQSLKGRDVLVKEINASFDKANTLAQQSVREAGGKLEKALIHLHKRIKP
ncbi:MAG TPA: hypothetical protein VGE55_11505 [Limnobacter sp.]|uniref:CsbD family protein n=1 Tax=Limnobacter sp. TaxID=2003368 RepID=UPI002EDA063F